MTLPVLFPVQSSTIWKSLPYSKRDINCLAIACVPNSSLIIEYLDLASLEPVRQFADKVTQTHPKTDFLINNAGSALDKYSTTKDGFEQAFGVHHLGHFLLTKLLLPVLKTAASSRIIIVSSTAYCHGQLHKSDLRMTAENYGMLSAYHFSKLTNLMHAVELSKRLEGTRVIAVSIHPGVVESELRRGIDSVSMASGLTSNFLAFVI
ncbi:Retinol dehydrogenase 13 [Fasciola hepatica]|uniref:Retinol dehydrogenase 13 n=1 Tax=Fasciola hepatica TaxID=6192 RepID=A0A4E0RE40_FASHE|nr:Retinol dehydrogenase 13 [Fasciola hepatica]